MSDFRAIRAVSTSLRDLLKAEMENNVPITIAPPDVDVSLVPGKRINLFLYKVDESAALKNMDLPGHGHPGAYGRPPLSLDLHYLITAYGENEEDQALTHELLGDAMRVLHDHAVILGAVLDPALRNDIEHVKVYLEPLALEELSKIWSALTKAMRVSASYLVTVVQIENRLPRKFARPVIEPPVGGPRIKAVTFRAPRIDAVLVIRHGDATNTEKPLAYARIADRLVLRGSGFSSDGLRVLLGEVDATASVVSIAPDRIEVTIPDEDALQPGPTRVMTQNDLMLGDPETPHRGFGSNVAVFVLVPEISALTKLAGPVRLQIDGTRLWHEDFDSLTITGDEVMRTYTTATPGQIVFEHNLPNGAYVVRVRVNGAESLDDQTLVLP